MLGCVRNDIESAKSLRRNKNTTKSIFRCIFVLVKEFSTSPFFTLGSEATIFWCISAHHLPKVVALPPKSFGEGVQHFSVVYRG